MSRTYSIDPSANLPIVSVRLFGRLGFVKLRLVVDTGAAMTQVNTNYIDSLGYSAADATALASIYGVSGQPDQGFALHVEKLMVLGKEFAKPLISACDMDNLAEDGLDGLLGFDLIRQFDLELRGMKGELVVH